MNMTIWSSMILLSVNNMKTLAYWSTIIQTIIKMITKSYLVKESTRIPSQMEDYLMMINLYLIIHLIRLHHNLLKTTRQEIKWVKRLIKAEAYYIFSSYVVKTWIKVRSWNIMTNTVSLFLLITHLIKWILLIKSNFICFFHL